jgi:hypothetical protein
MSKNDYWNLSDWMLAMRNKLSILAILLLVIMITGCASTGGKIADHFFEFNIKTDSPKNIEILEYKYGNSKILANSNIAKEGQPIYASHAYGKMLVGDFIYVKWRYKPTGEIIEKTVNIGPMLPEDMNGKGLYMVINEMQLVVYLIYKEKRIDKYPENGPSIYWGNRVETIFPSSDYIYKFKRNYNTRMTP